MVTLTTMEKYIFEVAIFIASLVITIYTGSIDPSECLLDGALIWLVCTLALDIIVKDEDNEE